MPWFMWQMLLLLVAAPPLEPPAANAPIFTKMLRLSLPLEPGQNLEELQTEPVLGQVRLVFSPPSKKLRQAIERQLGAVGVAPSFSGSSTMMQVEFSLPFVNLQSQLQRNKQTIKIDLGEGRYLPPYQPHLPFGVRLPPSWPEADQLIQAESDWETGRLEEAGMRLRELSQKGNSSSSELACILLSDLLAEQRKYLEAARTAASCVEKTLQHSSPLRALAEIKLIAYGGDLAVGDSPALYRDHPYQIPELKWLGEEIHFQRARLYLARGQRLESASTLIALIKSQPIKMLREPAFSMLRGLMLKIEPPENKEARAQFLARLVEVLGLFPASDERLEELVEKAGRLLVDAGAYLPACNIILWRLKNRRQSEVNPRLLTLLVEGLVELGDVVRAEKTLAFLLKSSPGASQGETAFLAGRVLELKNRPQAARLAYLQALGGPRRDQALRRAAGICADDQNCWAQLVKQAERLPPERRPEMLLFLGQQAYRAGQEQAARQIYERFATLWPQHEYCPLAAYRLLRLKGKDVECRLAADASDDARVWASAWAAVKKQAGGGRKNP